MPFVNVILPLNLDKIFTYSITEDESGRIVAGMRLAVPFGKNKIYTGLALEIHNQEPLLYEARPIDQILDETPVVTAEQIAHWKWIASYYMASLGDVYRTALPSALLLESETVLKLAEGIESYPMELDLQELAVVEALKNRSSMRISEVEAMLGRKSVLPIVRRLLAGNLVVVHEVVVEQYQPKKVRYVRLQEEFRNPDNLEALLLELKNAPKQKELLLHYFQLQARERKDPKVKELLESGGYTAAQLKGLLDKGIFEDYHTTQDRQGFEDADDGAKKQLSPAQQAAFESLLTEFAQKETTLLHGVTASGKTQVYFELIEKVLEQEQQVLYLLPEIALTAQLVQRLAERFGNQVTVYHSRYTANERVEAWHKVLEGSEKARVIIGARSALFLPFHKLGLIIVDEEHEASFKQQDPAPRYHARDAAIVLAGLYGARVLLGSATPSIETYQNCVTGKFGLVELNERFAQVLLPEIKIVDLKDAYFRKRMSGHFSEPLLDGIKTALENRQQVILFQNRRGYSPVLECLRCGHVPQCSQCDVSLTYHKGKGQLRCHYCGSSMAYPTHCHACHSTELSTKGFGTEQIELELKELFPDARVARMDQDTTRGKHAFEDLIEGLANRETDILVGTQMVAKGLDFDNVSLVGIMNADNMLYHPDFRALERSFQMMTQVAGRAGRSGKRGTVIIQTYNPSHHIIDQVTQGDYMAMFRGQGKERSVFGYPPYKRLVRLQMRHRDYETLKQAAQWLANVLRDALPVTVLGPEEPHVARIRNEYHRSILIKLPLETAPSAIKKTIQRVLDSFQAVSQFRAVKVAVNVDC